MDQIPRYRAKAASRLPPLVIPASHELSPPLAREAVPPSVKVTIGRIEVRAAAPPSPPPPAAQPRRPAMSLDDYLQRRSGGNR